MTWEPYMPLLPVTLISGEKSGKRPVMRRKKPDGSWEYRACTPEEEAEWVSQDAW